jgi:glycosyltransferase involved in cell wall biosynthesis
VIERTQAKTGRIRVVAVLTHPVQYYAAWFRWMHQHCAAIDLHVIYASRPTADQQGVGFDRSFDWDVPLTEGYSCQVVREAKAGDRFDAAHFYALNVPEIAGTIREAKPDVVLVFGWYSVTLLRAVGAARALKIPVLYHGDTNLQSAPVGWRRLLWIAKTRHLLSQFDGFLSVGVRSTGFLRFFGIPDDRIFAVPHAVDNERFSAAGRMRQSSERSSIRRALGLPEAGFVALFCGKLEAKKHPLDLIAAASTMTPPVHLAIVGTGALETDVRDAAERAGTPITMLGFVNQRELPRVYAAADCLVLPSDSRETWGLVVNEALAAGLPCVVADSAGCAPDLGGHATGGTYATAEPTEVVRNLAASIASVRERVSAGHDFARACAALSERHSFAAATAGLVAGCQRLLFRQAPVEAPLRVVACCGSMVLVGGLERMTLEILRVLRERGAIVHCVVNCWDNHRIVANAEQIGASWSTGYYWHSFTRHLTPLAVVRMLWDMCVTSGGLLRDTLAFRATHVLVSDYTSVIRNAPALAVLRLIGRTVIVRLGNAPDQGRAYRLIWRYAINPFVDQFVCNSPFTNRELAAHGIAERKRITIPHTPPTRTVEATPRPRDPRRLIYVGQIIPEKGLAILVEAVALLVARGHDVRLDVAGRIDGWVPPAHAPYRAAVLARAAQPDLRDRVRFLGYREDVPALMAEAAVHCCPSTRQIREGFGIVVIEAKSAGIPSVVFPSGNLPDLIRHGEDGWVCPEETVDALADGIERFLDPDRHRRAAAAARASAAAFSRDRFERSWDAVFAGGV